MTGDFPYAVNRNVLPEEIQLPDALPLGLPSTLLERRPDIRKAERELMAAHAEVGLAYTNMFPRLALTATLGAESETLRDLLKSPYSYLAGNLLSPLFAMGKNRAALKAKRAAYEGAVAEYELAQLQYINGVIGYLDLLDAQRNYFDAQVSLSNAVCNKQLMIINLYKALGGGWK